MEVFFSRRMGAMDTRGSRSRALGWMFGRCRSSCCPIAATPPTPPRGFFSSGHLPGTTPPPWFCSVPQDAAAATTDNKPSPSACGSIRGAATAFPHETDSSASRRHGDLLCEGLVLYKPWNKSVFNSYIVLFKRPLSSASTCHGCQVLFLSADLGSLLNLWPGSGKRAQKAIKSMK